MAVFPDPAPEATTSTDALAARYLEAFWRARETFAHAIAPVLRQDHDLDLRDYGILRLIERQALTPGDLTGVLQLPGYATSRLLDPLIKKGFVERRVDSGDARRYRLHLTPEGQGVTRTIEHRVAMIIGRHFSELGAERTELLVTSLETFAGLERSEPEIAEEKPLRIRKDQR